MSMRAHRSPGFSGGGGDVAEAYLRDVSRRSLLSRADEEELGRAIEEGRRASDELAAHGDRLPPERRRHLRELIARCEESTARFVESNLRLVVSIAKRYRHPRLPLPDLIQEGNVGLIQAVRRFDWKKGYRFSTYATFWIRQAILRAISSSGRLIRLPREADAGVTRIHQARAWLEVQRGREPTVEELAAEVGLTPARVAELLHSAADPVSVSEPTGEDGSGELGEFVADAGGASPLEEVLAAMLPTDVARVLGGLDERERRVLRLRYGLDGGEPRSCAAVGDLLGLSGERVRQLEARALRRLRSDPCVATAVGAGD